MKWHIVSGWMVVTFLASCGESDIKQLPQRESEQLVQPPETAAQEKMTEIPAPVSKPPSPVSPQPVLETPASRELARQAALQELQTMRNRKAPSNKP